MPKALTEKELTDINDSIDESGCLDDSQNEMVMTLEECRAILDDYQSSDDVIRDRIYYLTALSQNIIRNEIESLSKHE